MLNLDFDNSKTLKAISAETYESYERKAIEARKKLLDRTGAGSEFTGWIDLPQTYDKNEFDRIKKAALKIRADSEVLIVIGIGGSYLGARAAIEFLRGPFHNLHSSNRDIQIFFAGNSISASYIAELMDIVGGRDFSINVISKSGTTTEPAIAFRIFRKLLEERYGTEEASKRIYATTDKAKGALKELADKNGYETFVIPDDIGGRYSVLTAVGLLPIAAAGGDIDALIAGARDMRMQCMNKGMQDDPAFRYAVTRNALYGAGKKIEIMAGYEPRLHYIAEWWKQLFGESEGKEGKGIFPASVDLTTDLHSMGQYIQDGERMLMESVVEIKDGGCSLCVEHDEENTDNLNFLEGKTLEYINSKAMLGTMLAHTEGGVPCMKIVLSDTSAYTLGQLFYFYEFACGISGYMLSVNPFDQPGVESYKRNMFGLLGKPGYEKLKEELEREPGL